MTRWELMRAAWKNRDPVSSAEIVSGIRAGTVKVLQPAVRAGERFREVHPEAAERISRTVTAGKIRESVQIRRDIDTAQRRVVASERSVVVLDKKIALAPVRDGIFTGTDKQYLQHEADVKAYNSNINRINTENKRIATLEGKKFIPKLEKRVSSYIPTLADISKKGAQFRVKYPAAASTIYTAFERAHKRTERVGTQSQRNALAGYTYGSYSSLQRQPVKTAASFAIGGASVKAIKMAGLVGKAYGAGKWSKRMAKAAQYGLLAYYGKKSSEHIMSAPNSYVAGQRAANIMYTEVLPMAAGIKVVSGVPKVKVPKEPPKTILAEITPRPSARIPLSKVAKIKRELTAARIRTVEMMQNDFAQAGLPRGRRVKMSAAQTKARRARWAKKEVVKKEKFAAETAKRIKGMKARKQTVEYGKIVKKRDADIQKRIDRGELKEIIQSGQIRMTADGRYVVTPSSVLLQVMKVPPKPKIKTLTFKPTVMEKQISGVAKLKTEFAKPAVRVEIVKPPVKVVVKRKPVVRIKEKVVVRDKTLTPLAFMTRMKTATSVMYLFKYPPIVKVVPKPTVEGAIRERERLITPVAVRERPAITYTPATRIAIAESNKYIERINTIQKTFLVPKAIPPIIPPVVPPLPKRKAKKKPIRKDKQIVTYTPYQFKNRVASISSLFG
jgi:hypothetical protein